MFLCFFPFVSPLSAAPSAEVDPPDDERLAETARRRRVVLRLVFGLLFALVWLAFVEGTLHERARTQEAVAQRDANLATAVEHYVVRVVRMALPRRQPTWFKCASTC